MKYDTIEDGESTPLHKGGYSEEAPSSTKNKRTSSSIVRALLVGTAVAVGVLLLLTGPSSKMMTTINTSRNVVDGMVVSSTATQAGNDHVTRCRVAKGTFSGLSCKGSVDTSTYIGSNGYCAGPGESFGEHSAMTSFETCYVTITGLDSVPTLHYCWSHSHRAKNWSWDNKHFNLSYYRCDPFDDHTHISAPLADGSCGNPCPEVYSLWIWPPPKAF